MGNDTNHFSALGSHPQHAFYHYYRSTTVQLSALLASTHFKVKHRRPIYFFPVAYHLLYMSATLLDESGSPRTECTYPDSSEFSDPNDLWVERVKVTFIRLSFMVDDMVRQGLGDAEVLKSAWVIMMIRAMCWNRCHTLVSGKTIPIQYCGSQMQCISDKGIVDYLKCCRD